MKSLYCYIILLTIQCCLGAGLAARDATASPPACQINLQPDTTDIFDTSYVRLVRSAKLPSGATYRYTFSKPRTADKPYLLFLHGYPSTSFDWRHQIDYFSSRGYGLIVPDLLGCGGSDNPVDLAAFTYKNMANDIRELLQCEGVQKVFGIAHDFGSVLLSRLITYLPDALTGVAFLDIGYAAPPLAIDEAGVEKINNITQAALGYPIFGYWYFMNEDDSAPIQDAHMESAFTLSYTFNHTLTQEDFAPVGTFKEFLLENRMAPIGQYVNRRDMEIANRIIRLNGGYDGPVKWYKATMRGLNAADEKVIPASAANITQPVLLVTATEDRVGIAGIQVNGTEPFAGNFQLIQLESGHFVQLQKAHQVNQALEKFVGKVLANGTAGCDP